MDEIRHGLDLPNEEAEKVFDRLIKELGITEADIFSENDD